jgi:hypothetical protein
MSKTIDAQAEVFLNLLRAIPFALIVTAGLAFVKLFGPYTYTWLMVFVPMLAVYVSVMAFIIVVLAGAIIMDKFFPEKDLTDSDESGKLDTSA